MNKWQLSLLLLLLITVTVARGQIFPIDSLPATTGVLLDKGWKFHIGDNAEWIKPEFDDSNWNKINPIQDIHELPTLSKSGICWIRFHFSISDTSILKRPLAMMIKQSGASEIYLNGKYLYRLGVISVDPNKIYAYDQVFKPLYLPTTVDKKIYVLAIRYAKQPGIQYSLGYGWANPIFRVKIFQMQDAWQRFQNFRDEDATPDLFKIGLFFILAVLHLGFYIFLPSQKANLCLFLFAFMSMFAFYFKHAILDMNEQALRFYYLKSSTVLMGIAPLFILIATYYLFGYSRRTLRFSIVFGVTCAILNMILYEVDYIILFSMIILNFNTAIISFKAVKDNKRGAWIIFTGVTVFTLSTLFFAFQYIINYGSISISYYIMNVSVPLFVSIYLGIDFATTNQLLSQKLFEVKQLADEKETTLLRKNAELQAALLQGQTLERQRVAADLHDNLGTTLSALHWNLEAMDTTKLSPVEQAVYATINQQVNQAYNDVRLLSHNLLPDELARRGLAVALRNLVDKMNRNTPVCFHLTGTDDLPRLDRQTEFELYSICLELLNNTIKHAHATEGFIDLTQANGRLYMTVGDNGTGVTNQRRDGRGLQNVAARVDSLGGTWVVDSTPDGGVQNRIAVPVRTPARASSQT